MECARIVLEYLRVFLSGQAIAGAVAINFIFLFKVQIGNLIDRIKELNFPGGGLKTSQLGREKLELPSKGQKPESLPAEEPSTNVTVASPQPNVEKLQKQVNAERARAYLWEYRYLNYYLARGTQEILDWFAGLQTNTTVSLFDTIWLPAIPSAQERRAIIGALQAHWLIVITGDVIEVSPKGREYLAWRGPLPPWQQQAR